MRKLNKIIKQYTPKKLTRKKKNTEVFEYFEYVLSFTKNKIEYKNIRTTFEKLQKFLFLERYFDKEMREKDLILSDILFEYLDFDLYIAEEDKTLKQLHMYLNNNTRVKEIMNTIPSKINIINNILKEDARIEG